jgi:cytochrome c-type biogenesis protein CcmE
VNKAYIIAFVVISLALGFTMWSFSSSLTPYVDVKTAKKTSSAVQIRGIILRDADHPIKRDSKKNALRFWIKDPNQEEIEVVYYGAKPDAFDSAPGTAAHGFVRHDPEVGRDVFASDSLIVQCPSKYNDSKIKDSMYKKTASAGK